MTPTTITNTETCQATTTTVKADAATNTTNTETITDNQTTTITETQPLDTAPQCPCGNLDLRKLAEQTRCWSLKSSNIAAANANAVMIFALQVLQEILINECHAKDADINNIFIIASAIAQIGEVMKINNPQPFNS